MTIIEWHLDEIKDFACFGRNNITVTLKNYIIRSGWFTAEHTICKNALINFLNIDNSTIYTEVNAHGIIAISIIECIFENDYIHISHDLPKQ